MQTEVTRYRKPDGYQTRYWAVTVNGDLLAVTVYRRGAEAVARTINNLHQSRHVQTPDRPEIPATGPANATNGVATIAAR